MNYYKMLCEKDENKLAFVEDGIPYTYEELEKAAEETKDLTEQDLRDIADVMEGTYEYSVDEQVLTLTEMEYGSQKTFVREED